MSDRMYVDVQDRLQRYFRQKAVQLLAAGNEDVTDHSGLHGAHREAVIRNYLQPILPQRFTIDRGMVYGLMDRSRECDIVLWDAYNYPCLSMEGHKFFFAPSVRGVLEVKTRWEARERNDVLEKCHALHSLIGFSKPSLADDIAMLQLDVAGLKQGLTHSGILSLKPRIATGAIFLFGGGAFSLDTVVKEVGEDEIQDSWPDLLLLLEAGLVVIKEYDQESESMNGQGYLRLFDAGQDALLVFTAMLLGLITDRSFQVEDPLYLVEYITNLLSSLPLTQKEFPVFGPLPGRVPLWGS
jgi:hypothetical protein